MKKIICSFRLLGLGLSLVLMPLATPPQAAEENRPSFFDRFAAIEKSGFCELRAGLRTREDPHEEDISVMESRAQLELATFNDWADFKYKSDLWADGVTEQIDYDTREAWVFSRPVDFLDVKFGRQVLTWGTGDLVFLNDLFPKDWQSFFIGRDKAYLKAPSDAVKLSFFDEMANMDFIYTPKFDPDRYVTGKYVSYWSGTRQSLAGKNARVHAEKPDRWFEDDEIAVRIYKNIHNYEYALYGYWGFWKNPQGQTASGTATFPELNVYGASARGQVGRGIGNMEIAYYYCADDQSGSDPLVRNSEMRYLAGYMQELAKDLNASLQYYVEHMLEYHDYKENLESGPAKDEYRHVITLQLTKLLMNQNLTLTLSGYYSPSDADTYIMPHAHYKWTDSLSMEAGGNIFYGDESHTFFAQFENNTNIYTAIRYSF